MTINGHQLQRVRGASTVQSLAYERRPLWVAADHQVGVRVAVRYEFIAKQSVFNDWQQVEPNARRQRIAGSSGDEVVANKRQEMHGFGESGTNGAGRRRLRMNGGRSALCKRASTVALRGCRN